MTYCCAIGCNNSSERKRKDGVTFHKLPKDPDQRAKWIEAINRPHWKPTVHSALCSAHFPEAAIDRTSQSCVRLREGVVPSIFAGVTRDAPAPGKKSEPKKISFEELIKQRGKFHRELTEVLEDLIQIRKERKRLNQIKRRIGIKVESLKKLLSEDTSLRTPRKELEMELEDAYRRLVETEEEIATSTEQKDALYSKKTDLECKLKYLPVPLKFKLDATLMPSNDPKALQGAARYGVAGSSKRPGSEEGGKKKKPTKKLKTAEDIETERDVPDSCLPDPFDMIEIEEPIIKEEIFETEEFSEMKSEDILPSDGSTQEKSHFETVFCTPGIIKEERPDYVETPCGYDTTEADTMVPEFVQTVIKSEPPEEEEDENEEGETEPRVSAPLTWRCPLVSCPEMFSSELEMYQHLNLNHVVKSPGSLSSKSKKASTLRPVTTSPAVTIPSASGLVFLTSSSSSPRLSPVMVPCSQSVPSSSCGPVTVTTTLSYSSTTDSSSPLVSTVSSSPVLSVSCATLISSASPSVMPVPSGFTLCPPTSSPVAVSTSVPDVSASTNVSATDRNSLTSPNPHPVTTTSQGLKKLIVAPISNLDPSSSGPKKFLLLAPQHSQQPQQKSATKTSKAQPVQIFHPTEPLTEDFPPCALDDSEMFSISLARFPQNRRVPVKRKLIDVVDCMKQKNIGPDKLLIAFYEDSSDSRTM